jgi:uncharacterized membrane protein YwzB
MNLILSFIFEFLLYFIGYWALKAITLGRFEDRKVSYMVSFVGLLIVVMISIVIFYFGAK